MRMLYRSEKMSMCDDLLLGMIEYDFFFLLSGTCILVQSTIVDSIPSCTMESV